MKIRQTKIKLLKASIGKNLGSLPQRSTRNEESVHRLQVAIPTVLRDRGLKIAVEGEGEEGEVTTHLASNR